MTTVYAELKAALKIEPKTGEEVQPFLDRLARKANNLEDDGWQALSEPAQLWVNSALDALEKKRAIPIPAGSDQEEEGGEEKAPTKKTAKTKTKGKKEEAAPVEKAKTPKTKAAEKAAAKAKDKKAADAPSGRGPKGKFARTDKIKIVPDKNPFREKTKCYAWFSLIKPGMTVAEAVEAGAPRHHIRWARELGHLEIGS